MTLGPIHPRAAVDARAARAVAAAKPPVAIASETWIVQQEFEDDEGGNRPAEGSEPERPRPAWTT